MYLIEYCSAGRILLLIERIKSYSGSCITQDPENAHEAEVDKVLSVDYTFCG